MPRFEVQANYSPYPQSQTGACVLCGAGLRDDFENSGRRERVVSTGTRRGFADRRGETEEEFCESCAVCIGRAVGMVQPAEVDAARLDVARFRAERDQALAEAEDLRTAVAALERAGWRAPDGDASTAPEGVERAEDEDLIDAATARERWTDARRQITDDPDARARLIVELRGQGLKFGAIGERVGLTGERCGQIFREQTATA